MSNVISGSKYPEVQPRRVGRTSSGIYFDVPFETTDAAEADRMLNQALIAGVLFDADYGFGKHKIVFHYPYNFGTNPAVDPPVDLWELQSNKVQKSILDSSNPVANSLPQGDLFLLNLFFKDPGAYTVAPIIAFVLAAAVFENPDQAGKIDATKMQFKSANAYKLANLRMSGVENFDINVPVLRFTRTVNFAYPIRASNLNVGSILSTNSIATIENVPKALLFNLPNDLDPTPADADKAVLRYGWYKNAPSVNQVARAKWQIVTTWEYGLWLQDLYGAPL
jgi:hypothetical protein